MTETWQSGGTYIPEPRLSEVYEEAIRMDKEMLDSMCPIYSELKEDHAQYIKLTRLGEGSTKEVYKAYDRKTERWIAFAVLNTHRGLKWYDSFVREARLISSMSHPNIIKVHDIGVCDDGRPYFTMDLKSENTLAALLKTSRCERSELLNIYLKICDAVAYAHAQGVIHLDLKPENIQCDAFGEVLVCDWGLAESINLETSESLTDHKPECDADEDPVIQGSLGYMAPEQASLQTKGTYSDIYALGCILHTMLVGAPPFTGNKDEILASTIESKVVAPRDRFPKQRIPRSLNAIIMKAMERDPLLRYSSVSILQQDIQSYLTGFSTQAEFPSFYREAQLFFRRNRLPVTITLFFLIAGSIGAMLFLQNLQQQRLETKTERQRSEGLLSTVDGLHAKNDLLLEQIGASNQQRATKLAVSANRLRSYGIFDQPVITIEQSENLVKLALNQDPSNAEASWELFSIACLKLNYEAALKIPLLREAKHGYFKLAHAFPEFNFSTDNPVQANDLVQLFTQAKRIVPGEHGHLERILVYQLDLQPDFENKEQVLAAYIAYLNNGPDVSVHLEYDAVDSSMRISSNASLVLNNSSRRGGSNRCILRVIPFDTLRLDVDNKFDLSELAELKVKSIDISHCSEVSVNNAVNLPQLQRIYIRSGQLENTELRRFIRSDYAFEIIER